jgi:hypothetical protein
MAAQMGFDTAVATIAAGASLSGAVPLGVGRVRGILMPGVWTAAAISFQVSIDGTTFVELIDDRPTIAYVYTAGYAVAASQFLAIDPVLFDGTLLVKVRSGVAATPVNQVAQALVTLALRLV